MYRSVNTKSLIMAKSAFVLAVSALLTANTAIAASFSARNAAMGGAGVASSSYDAAAGSNAALLTRFDENDDVSIVLPAIGAEVSDEFDVIDTLNDISDDYDTLEQQIDANDVAGAEATRDNILDGLEKIDQQPVRTDAAALVGFAMPDKSLAVAVEVRVRLDLFVFADYAATDAAVINAAIIAGDSDVLDSIDSSALAFGAAISEVAVSFAHEFTLGEMPLAVGLTPKYQKVETILYNQTVNNFDEDDFDADEYTEDDSNLNLDIGFALSVTDSLTVGIQLRDLIEESYDTVQVAGYTGEYTIKPMVTAGVAWNSSWVTLAFDVDLTEEQPFDEIDGSQFARAGAELNLRDWFQLRAGVRHDLSDTRADLLTAGIGVSPFDTLHLDLTAAAGDKDTFGAAFDIRLTF